MINKNNQNILYNQENTQNKRKPFPQNKQVINRIPINIDKNSGIPNSNYNNIRRNKQNRNININNSGNNDLERAFLIIKNELKKKDDRIRELERKVSALNNKLNLLTNNNNNYNIEISPMETPYKESPKNIYNDKVNNNMINNNLENIDNKIDYKELMRNRNNIINISNNKRSISQTRQPSNHGYNSDNENIIKRMPGYDNLSHSNENSVLTYNGIYGHSKQDVKQFLKEVKEKIEPKKFKEFIRNIKLLTAKNRNSINRATIIESVQNIFGIEHLDLFLKFEKIVGVSK